MYHSPNISQDLFNSLFFLLAHPILPIKFLVFLKKQLTMNFLLFQNIPLYSCHEVNTPFLLRLPDLLLQYYWKHRIAQSMKEQYTFFLYTPKYLSYLLVESLRQG